MNLKEQYTGRLKERLRALNTEIARLDEAMDRVPPHLKTVLEEQIAPLRQKQEEARRQLADFQATPGGLTDELKRNAEALWSLLHEAAEHARQQYKSQRRGHATIVGKPYRHVYAAATERHSSREAA